MAEPETHQRYELTATTVHTEDLQVSQHSKGNPLCTKWSS